MKPHHRIIFAIVICSFSVFILLAESPSKQKVKRVLWTSKIQGTPEPPAPYQTEVAFPKLRFASPIAMNVVPKTNRLAVAERYGKIFTFENKSKSEKELLIDMKRPIMGLAFHPQFTKNGQFFVTTIAQQKDGKRHMRVSRFQCKKNERWKGDLKSEVPLLHWMAAGHTGGCLRFGPDGYLYIAVGDGSGIADGLLTGQDLSDFQGSILRINVDKSTKEKAYSIPADNPFIKTPGAKPEIYSYGHRQPWKFCFDRTGRIYCGEVGQDLWEMINIIKKGGNYGWSVREGSQPFRPERKKGPTRFIDPIVEHNHNDFRSITGGYVSYSNRLPKLKGAYIYADYDTGRVWSLRYDGKKVSDNKELTDTTYRIVAFGTDNAGEIYLVDFVGGQLHRLIKAPPEPKTTKKFPRKLSETGLFASVKDHIPAPGVIPYSVNAPLYSDHAIKERFLAIPGQGKIDFDSVTYPQPAPGADPGWRFPDGTVLVKTFSLEMEVGNPKSLRRLETRILHHKRMTGVDNEYGAQVWLGYTYVWNDEQTDAVLLDAKGLDRTFTIRDKHTKGGTRKQTWHFPSRAECTLCHTMAAKYVLGVNTAQMNKTHQYGERKVNQLEWLEQLGLFSKPLPKRPKDLPRLVDYRDTKADIDVRARSYLHSNCAHCHRKWGGGNAEFQLLAPLELNQTGTLGVRPQHDDFELKNPMLIVPGEPERSMILHRMTRTGLGRMPHVSSNVVDRQAVKLIQDWITKLR